MLQVSTVETMRYSGEGTIVLVSTEETTRHRGTDATGEHKRNDESKETGATGEHRRDDETQGDRFYR